jgi:hypothetical protein
VRIGPAGLSFHETMIPERVRRCQAAGYWRTLRPPQRFGALVRLVFAQGQFRGFLRDLVPPAMRAAGYLGPAPAGGGNR